MPYGQQYGYQQPYNYGYGNAQQPYSLIKVTGIEGAKAFQMPPNSAVAMFDANEDIFYVKTTDGAGFPTLNCFSFAPIPEQQPQQQNFVTRDELQQMFEDLRKEIKGGAKTNGKQPVSE